MTADSQARMRGYDVEYRVEPAGSWMALLSGTAQTQTEFGGEEALSYRFRVRAVDNVGNANAWVEGEPSAVQTTVTKYYYLAGQPSGEGRRVAMRQGGTLIWLLGDHLGSATITATENGTLASEQKYTAWGQTRSGSVGTDRQYTGQISEPQLGLYFYNARFYDSYLARFIQADIIIPQPGNPMAWDRYAYGYNNPSRYTDPTGHTVCDEEGWCHDKQGWYSASGKQKTTVETWKKWIRSEFGVTMSDAIQKWDAKNLSITYYALKQIDHYLGGKTTEYTVGANFYLASKESGKYSGWTSGTTITFYTSSYIPTQNIYHEYGHLLDNVFDDRMSTALGSEAIYYDGEYLFGEHGVGSINSKTLKSLSLYDPNWVNPVDAVQHPSNLEGEQWADIFANMVAGNIANNDQGYVMWTWIFSNFH